MNCDITSWQPSSHPRQPAPGELHLWRFKFACLMEENKSQKSLLSTDELARVSRLLDPQKKQLFISARCHLRQLLGQYLDVPAALIQFRYTANGKPFLAAQHEPSLLFNLSHSNFWGVIVVSSGVDVGIDIEKIDPDLEFQQLANRYFNLKENDLLNKYLTTRKRRGFYRLWTRKEAVLKMQGSGFNIQKLEERLLPTANDFCLKNLFLAPGYVSAVAASGEIRSIIKSDFSIQWDDC